MAIGTLGALAISTGASIGGKIINDQFNERPDVPDLTSEVDGKFDKARRTLERKQDRQSEQVKADAAAAGVNPVSAVADVIQSNNQASADLEASEADAKARAENQEKRMKYGKDKRIHRSRAQGIGSIVSGISNYASNKAAINALKEDDDQEPEDPGGGEGGGDGGGSGGASQGASTSYEASGTSSNASQEPTSSVDATRDQSSMGTTLAPSTGASGNSGTGALDAIVGGGLSFLQNVQGGMKDQTNPLITQLAMDGAEGLLG